MTTRPKHLIKVFMQQRCKSKQTNKGAPAGSMGVLPMNNFVNLPMKEVQRLVKINKLPNQTIKLKEEMRPPMYVQSPIPPNLRGSELKTKSDIQQPLSNQRIKNFIQVNNKNKNSTDSLHLEPMVTQKLSIERPKLNSRLNNRTKTSFNMAAINLHRTLT